MEQETSLPSLEGIFLALSQQLSLLAAHYNLQLPVWQELW